MIAFLRQVLHKLIKFRLSQNSSPLFSLTRTNEEEYKLRHMSLLQTSVHPCVFSVFFSLPSHATFPISASTSLSSIVSPLLPFPPPSLPFFSFLHLLHLRHLHHFVFHCKSSNPPIPSSLASHQQVDGSGAPSPLLG